MENTLTPSSTSVLRDQLAWLRARHDGGGAVSLATYNVVKALETELAWRQHAQHREAEA